MRVFACPRGPEAMIPDALSERANYQPAVKRFETAVADLLRAQGYTGARTGKVVQFPIADGYACYMVAENPRGTFALVHLPIGDAWQIPAPYARGLTKADILTELRRQERFHQLFTKA